MTNENTIETTNETETQETFTSEQIAEMNAGANIYQEVYFEIEQKDVKTFLAALNDLKTVVQAKSTIPVLTNIKISASDNFVILTGTDLDNTLILEVPANVYEKGEIIVELQALINAIGKTSDAIEMVVTSQTTYSTDRHDHLVMRNEFKAKVSTGNINLTLDAVDVENFPSLSEMENLTYQTGIDFEVLNDLIVKTAYAATKEQSRFSLQAVSMEFGLSGLRMIATDGHRMSLADSKNFNIAETIKTDDGREYRPHHLLNLAAVKPLAKFAPNFRVIIETDDNYIIFSQGEQRKLIARKSSGTFPNYEMVLPKENKFSFRFNTNEVLQALETSLKMSDARTKSVKFQPYYNNLVFKANDDTANFSTKVTCDFPQNSAPAIGVNTKYLIDVIKADKGDKVLNLAFTDTSKQFEITGQSEFVNYKCLVMPLCSSASDIDGQIITDDEKASLTLANYVPASEAKPKPATKPKAKAKKETSVVINPHAITNAYNELLDALAEANVSDELSDFIVEKIMLIQGETALCFGKTL